MHVVVVFITKHAIISSMLIQFTALAYPRIEIEVAGSLEEITTKQPFRVVAIMEEAICGELLKNSKYPGKLRMVREHSVIFDFDEIMRSEGVEWGR